MSKCYCFLLKTTQHQFTTHYIATTQHNIMSYHILTTQYHITSQKHITPQYIIQQHNITPHHLTSHYITMTQHKMTSHNTTHHTTQHSNTKEQRNTAQLLPPWYFYLSIVALYRCPLFSGEDNRVPAKCLVCGKWFCSEGWCCKKTVENQNLGSCTAHAATCGAGVGIFLRVADCIILLLNGVGKGCFYPSPYLDAYGENDPGLR